MDSDDGGSLAPSASTSLDWLSDSPRAAARRPHERAVEDFESGVGGPRAAAFIVGVFGEFCDSKHDEDFCYKVRHHFDVALESRKVRNALFEDDSKFLSRIFSLLLAHGSCVLCVDALKSLKSLPDAVRTYVKTSRFLATPPTHASTAEAVVHLISICADDSLLLDFESGGGYEALRDMFRTHPEQVCKMVRKLSRVRRIVRRDEVTSSKRVENARAFDVLRMACEDLHGTRDDARWKAIVFAVAEIYAVDSLNFSLVDPDRNLLRRVVANVDVLPPECVGKVVDTLNVVVITLNHRPYGALEECTRFSSLRGFLTTLATLDAACLIKINVLSAAGIETFPSRLLIECGLAAPDAFRAKKLHIFMLNAGRFDVAEAFCAAVGTAGDLQEWAALATGASATALASTLRRGTPTEFKRAWFDIGASVCARVCADSLRIGFELLAASPTRSTDFDTISALVEARGDDELIEFVLGVCGDVLDPAIAPNVLPHVLPRANADALTTHIRRWLDEERYLNGHVLHTACPELACLLLEKNCVDLAIEFGQFRVSRDFCEAVLARDTKLVHEFTASECTSYYRLDSSSSLKMSSVPPCSVGFSISFWYRAAQGGVCASLAYVGETAPFLRVSIDATSIALATPGTTSRISYVRTTTDVWHHILIQQKPSAGFFERNSSRVCVHVDGVSVLRNFKFPAPPQHETPFELTLAGGPCAWLLAAPHVIEGVCGADSLLPLAIYSRGPCSASLLRSPLEYVLPHVLRCMAERDVAITHTVLSRTVDTLDALRVPAEKIASASSRVFLFGRALAVKERCFFTALDALGGPLALLPRHPTTCAYALSQRPQCAVEFADRDGYACLSYALSLSPTAPRWPHTYCGRSDGALVDLDVFLVALRAASTPHACELISERIDRTRCVWAAYNYTALKRRVDLTELALDFMLDDEVAHATRLLALLAQVDVARVAPVVADAVACVDTLRDAMETRGCFLRADAGTVRRALLSVLEEARAGGFVDFSAWDDFNGDVESVLCAVRLLMQDASGSDASSATPSPTSATSGDAGFRAVRALLVKTPTSAIAGVLDAVVAAERGAAKLLEVAVDAFLPRDASGLFAALSARAAQSSALREMLFSKHFIALCVYAVREDESAKSATADFLAKTMLYGLAHSSADFKNTIDLLIWMEKDPSTCVGSEFLNERFAVEVAPRITNIALREAFAGWALEHKSISTMRACAALGLLQTARAVALDVVNSLEESDVARLLSEANDETLDEWAIRIAHRSYETGCEGVILRVIFTHRRRLFDWMAQEDTVLSQCATGEEVCSAATPARLNVMKRTMKLVRPMPKHTESRSRASSTLSFFTGASSSATTLKMHCKLSSASSPRRHPNSYSVEWATRLCSRPSPSPVALTTQMERIKPVKAFAHYTRSSLLTHDHSRGVFKGFPDFVKHAPSDGAAVAAAAGAAPPALDLSGIIELSALMDSDSDDDEPAFKSSNVEETDTEEEESVETPSPRARAHDSARVDCLRICDSAETRWTIDFSSDDSFEIERPRCVVAYADVSRVHRRNYNLQQTALEVFTTRGLNFFVSFRDGDERERVFAMLRRRCGRGVVVTKSVFKRMLKDAISAWTSRRISNFEYLLLLNELAGRSFNDVSQYPVFPWVLSDYTSEVLDLENPGVYRDLSKPMGAQYPDSSRCMHFVDRFKSMSPEAAFHYGTHFSCSAYVCGFLIRMEPYASMDVHHVQGGRFDRADRIFDSVGDAWSSASLNNAQDVRELIPEFFNCSEFLLNSNGFEFGHTQKGRVVDDVALPPWATDASDFIKKHNTALESEHVSANLHSWIDLIFGFKRDGKAAVEASNVFHPCSYVDRITLLDLDASSREATVDHVRYFGAHPNALFASAHESRRAREDATSSCEVKLLSHYRRAVGDLSFTSDSSTVMNVRCDTGRVYVLEGGKKIVVYRSKKVERVLSGSCAITAWCVAASTVIAGNAEGGVMVWGGHARRLIGHSPAPILCVAATTHLAVSLGADGEVLLWELATCGPPLRRIGVYPRARGVALSGNTLLVYGATGVCVFDASAPSLGARCISEAHVTCACVSGQTVWYATADALIQHDLIFEIARVEPVAGVKALVADVLTSWVAAEHADTKITLHEPSRT